MEMTSLPEGYRALVIGASGGIGKAVMRALEDDPGAGEVLCLSRSKDGLDITNEESVARCAGHIDGELHLLFCATGALTIDGVGPEKALKQISAEAMTRQFALNALGPALVLKHFGPKLRRDGRTLTGILSARVGSIGDNRLGGWVSYRASKAALNQIVRTASIELARTHKQSVLAALHPGTVATDLTAAYAQGRDRLEPDDSAGLLLGVLDRLTPADTGNFYAYDGTPVEW